MDISDARLRHETLSHALQESLFLPEATGGIPWKLSTRELVSAIAVAAHGLDKPTLHETAEEIIGPGCTKSDALSYVSQPQLSMVAEVGEYRVAPVSGGCPRLTADLTSDPSAVSFERGSHVVDTSGSTSYESSGLAYPHDTHWSTMLGTPLPARSPTLTSENILVGCKSSCSFCLQSASVAKTPSRPTVVYSYQASRAWRDGSQARGDPRAFCL